jgi:hypothetical protein
MATKGEYVVVRSPFFLGSRMISAGDVYAVDDPVALARPTSFKPFEVKVSAPEPPRVRRVVRKSSTKPKSRQARKKS